MRTSGASRSRSASSCPELIELPPEEPSQVSRCLLGVPLHERRDREPAGGHLDQNKVGPAVNADVRAPLPVPGSVRPVAGDASGPGQPRLRMHMLEGLEGVALNERAVEPKQSLRLASAPG